MDRFRIEGGTRLQGIVRISGAKNSALPAMAAALLSAEPVHLKNIPRVRDIITLRRLLTDINVRVETPDLPPTDLTLQAEKISDAEAPYDLVRTMRASILTLGPLMGRLGYARVSLPGGCAIGARPIDLHLKALERMGAQIITTHGYVEARVPADKRLRGGHIVFEKITVTGTENVLMASTLAEGETLIENAAREPEVADLADLLIKMGAQIEGAGTSTLRIRGVSSLHGATHAVIPDRIEAGTFLVAAPITGGELVLEGCAPQHLTAVLWKLAEVGVEIRQEAADRLRVRSGGKLAAADVTTEEYPGLATDMHAQYMVLSPLAAGAC